MANFLITVAIITRNRANSLKRLLKSLEIQTVLPLELLIIDNASTDDTKKVVDEFSLRIKNIRYLVEKNIGIPYARNRALKEARGKILAFIDDDCQAPTDWISKIQEFHALHPKVLAIQGWSESLPKTSPISILSQHNRELFIKTHIMDELLRKKLGDPRNFKRALTSLHFKINALDTKNASFKLNKLRTLRVRFDTSFHRGSDVDFGKQIISKGGEIILCPQLKVAHWERKTIKEFLIQRFYFAQGSVKSRKKWNYGTPRRLAPYRRIRFFIRYFKSLKIAKRRFPIAFSVFILDKIVTYSGHFTQRRKLSHKLN